MIEQIFEATNSSLYDPEDDRSYFNYDTRKPKLTLKKLNKLRMYREYRNNETNKKKDIVAIVYANRGDGNNM